MHLPHLPIDRVLPELKNVLGSGSAVLAAPPGSGKTTIGCQIRFDRRISATTRIEVVTEGILTRRIQDDNELLDTGLVIFDEFHERSLPAAGPVGLGSPPQRTVSAHRYYDLLRLPEAHPRLVRS